MYKDHDSAPYKITPKSYALTRDTKTLANPMIMLNVASVMSEADSENEKYYYDIITLLIEDVKCFYKPEYRATFENISAKDNSVILESSPMRVINPGHDIECSWFLLEQAIKRDDKDLAQFAKTMFDDAFALGWDNEFGGILYFKDVLGKPVEAYEHDMKLWWPHNEAVIASFMLYKYTGNKKYFEIFEKVTDYAFSHFPEREYGEWYGYLRRDGAPTEPRAKGNVFKGPFHVPRMYCEVIQELEKLENQ